MSLVHGLDDAALCIRHAMRIHDMNGYSNSYDECFAITYIRPLFIMEEVNYLLLKYRRLGKEEMGKWRNSLFTIFVGNLCPTIEWQEIKDWFDRFGVVMDVYLPRPKNRGRNLVVKVANRPRDSSKGIKVEVGPRSYKDVLKARVNTNDSNEHSLNREETKSEAKAEFVGANKENKKETERLLEMARQMGKQDEDNGVGPLKGWMECSAQLGEAENDWLNSSAVGRPRVDFSNEEIQRSLQAKGRTGKLVYGSDSKTSRLTYGGGFFPSDWKQLGKVTSEIKITSMIKVMVDWNEYWIRAIILGSSDLNNIDSADNKSSTKKRNNGENGLMAPSMAEETQMVAGCNGSSWKENGGNSKDESRTESANDSVKGNGHAWEEAEATWNLSRELGVQYRADRVEVVKFFHGMERETNGQRGLGRAEKKRALRKLIRAEKPSMVFIQETKMKSMLGSFFNELWKDDEIEGKTIEAEGRSGGILMGFNQQREENTRPPTTWERPGVGTIKFNVDGAANGCPGEVEIGGLLRNENGEVLIKFFKAVGWGDSNMAEYLGIREAFILGLPVLLADEELVDASGGEMCY
ncbi:Uncharacterized protein TCM_016825 [Theobroma cacao]|uniref:RRM domain-containing protein n=1 Tax=Theobroma cacao TaxID=3641 RepID=A0A061EBE4_THECC|nr:Uncharacterized protein TCM_016825 [Theobroma cacao]